jgi:hypothetical protein
LSTYRLLPYTATSSGYARPVIKEAFVGVPERSYRPTMPAVELLALLTT